LTSDARIGVWKLKQNCKPNPFEGETFQRPTIKPPADFSDRTPHRFAFPTGKGCGQKSPPIPQEPFSCNRQEFFQSSFDTFHRSVSPVMIRARIASKIARSFWEFGRSLG
jgi:hypothetical protein